MANDHKVTVSERALLQRINRKLKPGFEQIRAARGGRSKDELGGFYRLNTNRNEITDHHLELETLARDLGVLQRWEAVEE